MLFRSHDVPLGVQGMPVAEIQANDREKGFKDSNNDASLPSLEQAELELIKRALDEYAGNRRKAAEALGISERTLYRKIEQYGLQ